MDVLGVCHLCLLEKPLKESHYMPASLYRGGRRKHIEAMTSTLRTEDFEHLKVHLLCAKCENLFAENGESPVLKWIAPKAPFFPMLDRMKVALPREKGNGWDRYSGVDLGIDTEPFAYFGLSIVWRGAVQSWKLPDGQSTTFLELAEYQEPIRNYLRREIGFPDDVSVIVTVCTDSASRNLWFTPSPVEKTDSREFGILARGVYFRIVLNKEMDHVSRVHCCRSNGFKTIFLSNCEKNSARILDLFPPPLNKKIKDELLPNTT